MRLKGRMSPLLVLMTVLPLLCAGQDAGTGYRNGIKVNLVSLAARNISLQYERALGPHTSVLLGVRVEPRGKVPLKGILQNKYGGNANVDNFLDNTRLSNFALTPEFRYYFGRRPQNGIYLAPYLRYAHFNISWNYSFTDDDGIVRPINFTGSANYYSAGLMAGAQWHVGRRFLIDLWLAGVSIGTMQTDLNAAVDLSDMNDFDKKELQIVISSTAINGQRLDAQVSNAGVRAKGAFTVPGIRTGLCIGFVF